MWFEARHSKNQVQLDRFEYKAVHSALPTDCQNYEDNGELVPETSCNTDGAPPQTCGSYT